jgi:hypothetical protein
MSLSAVIRKDIGMRIDEVVHGHLLTRFFSGLPRISAIQHTYALRVSFE